MVAVVLNQTTSPAEETSTSAAKLPSVPNFRVLWSANNPKVRLKHSVFRSSRPDFIERDDLNKFKKLGIQCIIDFRSQQEYEGADGNRLLDEQYPLYNVKFPRGRNYRHDEPVQIERIKPRWESLGTADCGCKHYLINFFTLNYIWKVFNRAPWYIRLYSLLLLFYDTIFRTGRKYFVRLFARTTLNSTGLLGQYQDIIDCSQRSICAALKLLSDNSNLPALLNCAHGKDRTGIVSALVLSCLGKTPDYIAEEYALSDYGLAPVRKRVHSEVVERFHMSEEFTTAHAETMRQLFRYIHDGYGSVEDYLEYIGFGANEQQMLRRNLHWLQHEADVSPSDESSDFSLNQGKVN